MGNQGGEGKGYMGGIVLALSPDSHSGALTLCSLFPAYQPTPLSACRGCEAQNTSVHLMCVQHAQGSGWEGPPAC